MNPLDFLEHKQLLQFFHCHKTELSCMDKPHTFLSQLRDHDLIPEERYEKLSRMKSQDNLRKALYDLLDWLEKKHSRDIKDFWTCVFKETILNKYPALRLMRNSLMDGSFQFDIRLAEKAEKEETDNEDEEKEEKKENKEKKANSEMKKRKRRSRSIYDDDDEEEEEQAGSSSKSTPNKKKKPKISFSPSLKRGEKSEIWKWDICKHQLPVTCGGQNGYLNKDRLAKGEKCIVVGKQWFTPSEFEKFSGKSSLKNWKLSIRCRDTPLGKLIKDGYLKPGRYKGGCKKAKKTLIPSDEVITVSEGEEDEEDGDEDEDEESDHSSKKSSTNDTDEEEEREEQPGPSHDGSKKVFKVTCGALEGTLHENRFASGSRGKSIRTETSWLTPMEFLKEASCQTGAWRKDIKWEGNPLGILTEARVLKIHTLLCDCSRCKPDCVDVDYQKNDDECCICKNRGEEEEELVMCDHCPRSFHQKCHLPHVDDSILGDGILWMCTFCVFKTNEECYYKDELTRGAAMSKECQYLLLCLCTADEEQTFATNPALYLSDYSAVIETPMWLGNVADKLENQLYQTVGEFVSDVELIFANCASYNRDNAEYRAMGGRLKELFDGEFSKVFNINE